MYIDNSLWSPLLIKHFGFSEQLNNKITEQEKTAGQIAELEQPIVSVSARKSRTSVNIGINYLSSHKNVIPHYIIEIVHAAEV